MSMLDPKRFDVFDAMFIVSLIGVMATLLTLCHEAKEKENTEQREWPNQFEPAEPENIGH